MMLMRFSVKNYRSFKNLTEFTTFPGNVRLKKNHLLNKDTVPILKFDAIYGANAAGKSNLIKAIKDSRNIILNGTENFNNNQYFKLDTNLKYEYSEFEYEIEIKGKFYAYGFRINIYNKKIIAEWLYELRKDTELLIFERDVTRKFFDKKSFEDPIINLRFKIYELDYKVKTENLLLTEINRTFDKSSWNQETKVFRDVYLWFQETLDVSMSSSNQNLNLEVIFDQNNAVIEILKSFGIGITDYKFIDAEDNFSKSAKERSIPKIIIENIDKGLNESFIKGEKVSAIVCMNKQIFRFTKIDEENTKIETIVFKHAFNNLVDFYLDEESDGTIRIIELIKILLIDEEKVFIIDEIDKSLHPNLTYKFIEIFLNIKRKNNVQLIVTTHEDRILDLDILRKDEIWFAEKGINGSTELFRLDNFKPTFNEDILRAYLDGRFGAIPNLKNINIDSSDSIE